METFKNALQKSVVMLDLIRNISDVRRQLLSAKEFNKELFDKINGDDAALESLVDRDVFFDAMDQTDKVKLRREVMKNLAEQEMLAADNLRNFLAKYMSAAEGSLKSHGTLKARTRKATESLDNIAEPVKEALAKGTVDTGIYSKTSVKSAIDAFDKVTTFISKITPVMARVLADAEEEIDPDGSTAAEPEKINPEPELEPLEHSVIVPIKETDEAAMTEILATAKANRSMTMCLNKFSANGGKMGDLGYKSVEDLVGTISVIDSGMDRYVEAVEQFLAVFPVRTCTTDSLVRCPKQFLDTFDGVMNLVATCEDVRKNLDSTSLTLVETLEALKKGF